MEKYLRLYPIQWPTFSTKYYFRDSDGWWNKIAKKKKKQIENIRESDL